MLGGMWTDVGKLEKYRVGYSFNKKNKIPHIESAVTPVHQVLLKVMDKWLELLTDRVHRVS